MPRIRKTNVQTYPVIIKRRGNFPQKSTMQMQYSLREDVSKIFVCDTNNV